MSSSRALPGFPSNHLCAFLIGAFLIDGCVATKQQQNGNLGDIEEKSNLIKFKVCDKDFWKQICFTPRVRILSRRLVLFLKSSAISFGRKMHPIHGSRYVTVISLGTALRSGGWCQQNKTKESSPDPPPQKGQTNIWSKKSIRLKNKVSWQTSEETKRDRDMWQKWSVMKKMCRMETSFLISLTLVSNNNYRNPRKLHETTRSWSERDTHAHNQQGDSDWQKAREKEEEPWRKRMLYQSVTTNIRPNSLSVQIESDITRICAGCWDPSQSCGRERKR